MSEFVAKAMDRQLACPAGLVWSHLAAFQRPDILPQVVVRNRKNALAGSAYVVSVLALLAGMAPADARRLALVIGNDSYQHADALNSARADARAVADALKATGFKVTLRQDVTQQSMKEAIRTFKSEVSGGDEVVFYYAGHGVQLEGMNYMIPVDTAGDNPDQLKDDSVSLQRVLDDMQDQKARFTLAIIDACRDNPFKGNGRALRTRGLAPVTAADGQAVLYSAGAGQEALDSLGPRDKDPNGVFTRVLIKEMRTPGLSFDQVIHEVRNQVVQLATSVGHTQTPGYYSQFTGDFFFIPSAANQPAAAAPAATGSQQPSRAGAIEPPAASRTPPADEIAAYKAAEASNTLAGWQIFKRNYPSSAYAATADIRIASLTPSRTVAPAPREVQVQPQPQPQPAWSPVDPGMVGTFEYDTVYNFYDQQYIATISADGRCHLTIIQEESGTYQNAFGILHTTGAKTHHSRAGTYRQVSGNSVAVTGEAGTVVYQLMPPGATVNPRNPLLGTWHATFVTGGATWDINSQNNANGTFEARARFEDSLNCGYSNNQWHVTSTVTGKSDGGTYRIIDARNIEFTGNSGTSVWRRR
jgi:hypothetical protein